MAKIRPSDTELGDRFGHSVSLEGNRAVISALLDDDGGLFAGSAYLYVREEAEWVLRRKLLPDDVGVREAFGASVSLSRDRLLIGASADNDLGAQSGSAYLYLGVGDQVFRDRFAVIDEN